MQFDPYVLKIEALKVVSFSVLRTAPQAAWGQPCSVLQARCLLAFASIPLAALDSAQNTRQSLRC
jgi:hypothetical protein